MKHARVILLLVVSVLISAPAQPARVQTRCDALLASWKRRFDQEKLNYLVAPPFVIAGNGSPPRLERYRDGTILAAARALRATFFRKEPQEPVLILLFESEQPYRRLAKRWFQDDEVSGFGYFRRNQRVMLMNVGTGTGTLVHELTHALIEPDFPDVPDWFNEGLASLYEQCSLDGDTIKGHENWRLAGLQQELKAGRLRSLEAMIKDPDFYQDALQGVNYAQARYLMLYLQEKGLLTRYYKQFRENRKADPTGALTLKKVIAPQALEPFERDWRAWVTNLRF
jgi:hypothetical protein